MQTALEPESTGTDESPEETHTVCCDDHDRSLCGTIVDWTTQPENDREPSCVVCVDLDQANYCPYTGICRHLSKPIH